MKLPVDIDELIENDEQWEWGEGAWRGVRLTAAPLASRQVKIFNTRLPSLVPTNNRKKIFFHVGVVGEAAQGEGGGPAHWMPFLFISFSNTLPICAGLFVTSTPA